MRYVPNLAYTWEGIHEAEQLLSRSDVNHLVYHGKGKTVFWAGFVEDGEIYAYPPVPIIFLHKDWVCNPLRILGLTMNPSRSHFRISLFSVSYLSGFKE